MLIIFRELRSKYMRIQVVWLYLNVLRTTIQPQGTPESKMCHVAISIATRSHNAPVAFLPCASDVNQVSFLACVFFRIFITFLGRLFVIRLRSLLLTVFKVNNVVSSSS